MGQRTEGTTEKRKRGATGTQGRHTKPTGPRGNRREQSTKGHRAQKKPKGRPQGKSLDSSKLKPRNYIPEINSSK